MPKLVDFDIAENKKIAKDIWRVLLCGDCTAITSPGQFVNVALEGRFLRRPLSVCHVENDLLTLVYKVVGAGTSQLAGMERGSRLNLLTGLGNGFDIESEEARPLLVGGGVGVAPLYGLAEALIQKGIVPAAVVGFNTADEVFLVNELEALGVEVFIATADGSAGVKGFVTHAMSRAAVGRDYIYVCGPEPMLRAVYESCALDGQFSFERRMGCGFGACMGCSCETKYGAKRICRDGPVLARGEIKW